MVFKPPKAERLATANTQLAFDLFSRLRTQPGNIFFSPNSIAAALTMTYAGARGETARQMAKTLHLKGLEENVHGEYQRLAEAIRQAGQVEGIRLLLVNALWPQVKYPFRQEYLQLLQKYYATQVSAVDYASQSEAARREINQWVEQQTQGLIQELVPEGVLDALTRLTIVNAMYFKGLWAHPFDPADSAEAPFWVAPSVSQPTTLMRQTHSFPYAETNELQLVELPYAGERLGLVALLPRQPVPLQEVEQMLPSRLERWIQDLSPRPVHLTLPRLSLRGAFRLDETLQRLGMSDLFQMDKANLAGMDGNPNWLYVTAVLHQAALEVNEEGSEAAAATAVVVAARAMPVALVEFRADRPFLVLIRDRETQAILFMGRVSKPDG